MTIETIKDNRQTDEGTPYLVEKWTCPICKENKSTLSIDGEWCHGDSMAMSIGRGRVIEGCSECILLEKYK